MWRVARRSVIPQDNGTSKEVERSVSGAQDLLLAYLQEIRRHPILSKEEHQTLFEGRDMARKKAHAILGKYACLRLEEMSSHEEYTETEEEDETPDVMKKVRPQFEALVAGLSLLESQSVEEDNRALWEVDTHEFCGLLAVIESSEQKAIEHNLRAVVDIAKAFLDRGLPFLDLIQEGTIGLTRGVDGFEIEKGLTFLTYASWWIRAHIQIAVAEYGSTVRVPRHMVDRIRAVDAAAVRLASTLGRVPTDEELAHGLRWSADKMEKVRRIMARKIISFDAPFNSGELGDTEWHDRLDAVAPGHAENPADIIMLSSERGVIDRVLSILTPREADIIVRRFGLRGQEPEGLETIGKDYGLTRERIRQIEGQALDKFKKRWRLMCRDHTS